MKQHSEHSSLREKIIEYLFVGELLKYAWSNNDFSLEVSKPEVDNKGYDLVIEAQGVLRHIQLKASFVGAKTARQKLNTALSAKSSGCVVWILFDINSLELKSFLFFGGKAGEPLPDISELGTAKHTKANSEGHKSKRSKIRIINKGSFAKYDTIESIYQALFI